MLFHPARYAGALALLPALLAAVAAQTSAPDPRVRDNDPALTAAARPALPLITAIARYRTGLRRCPAVASDADWVRIDKHVPAGMVPEWRNDSRDLRGGTRWWSYTVSHDAPSQCRLTIFHVGGHDPSLTWWTDGVRSGWLYDPGDGSDPVPVKLDPTRAIPERAS